MTPRFLILTFVYVCGEIIESLIWDKGVAKVPLAPKINSHLTYYVYSFQEILYRVKVPV